MQATQRHQRIVERLREKGFVSVPELASECAVSEMTMRRDFDLLAERAMILRTHGGATLPTAQIVDLIEPNFHARTEVHRAEKAAIGKAAAALVQEGQTVALDIGSTTFELARALSHRAINIFTSSLTIAMYLSQRQANVYLPAGKVAGSEPSIVGAQAVQQIGTLNFDLAFIGVSGVSESGFYDYSLEDAEIKRKILSCSQRNVVLLDASKFNRMSVTRVSSFDGINTVITDTEPPENLRRLFDAAGIEVLIAK